MHYELRAQTAYFNLKGQELVSAEDRIKECEQEIAAALERHGCILIVQVAAKETT